MTNDPNHTANMHRVASLLTPVLIEAGADTDSVAEMADFVWTLAVTEAARRDLKRYHHQCDRTRVEDLVNVPKPWMPKLDYVPSASTRALVAAMIRAETAPTPTTDPFAGLYGVDD